MLRLQVTARFKRDRVRARKRGQELQRLDAVITSLLHEEPLAPKYGDHKLQGPWAGSRDVHIEPDWLLIYRVEARALILERTGTHADLFGR